MNNSTQSKKIKELAALSRAQLLGKYSIAIFVAFVIGIIRWTISIITEGNVIVSSTTGFLTSTIISLIVDLLLGILIFGQSHFYLKIARGDMNLNISDIFIGFKTNMDKAICIQAIFTGMSLLAFIPSALLHFKILYTPEKYYYYFAIGITVLELLLVFLAKLFFGLSFYILSDNPDWSVTSIFKESLYRMKNKKGKLLLTYLSTIPLLIVSFLSLGIGLLWFMPYYNNLLANFYLDAIGEDAWDPEHYVESTTEPPEDDSPTLDIRL